ncbi:MAG TPA: xanthine dehydrogenase family protein subunit M [Thermodesulfobacteriota bacterium]|nr:xanthine dehydrogenase family protein subunit M [Thermodesulfobacteriota bacterium]
MHSFEYFSAPDVKTAVSLLKDPRNDLLAGGTDVLGQMKRRIRNPERLVNIKNIESLKGIRDEGETIRIGALALVSEIEGHPGIAEKLPSLRAAASLVGSPQLRNMGTLGGNLCQRPRCWYFRNHRFPCWLKGGEKCFAVAGENKLHRIAGEGVCHSVHPSDLAPVLISLGARVKIAAPRGEREIPLEDLYMLPRKENRQTTVLKLGEILTEVAVPANQRNGRGVFLKLMERKAWSFAVVSIALHLQLKDNRIADPRILVGGAAPIPWRTVEAEKVLAGKEPDEEVIAQTVEAAVSGVRPMRDNGYKVPLLKSLVRKVLEEMRV